MHCVNLINAEHDKNNGEAEDDVGRGLIRTGK